MSIASEKKLDKKFCFVISIFFSLIVLTAKIAADDITISDEDVYKAVSVSYSEMNLPITQSARFAIVISVRDIDFASDEGTPCKYNVPNSDQNMERILSSREYQIVDARCSTDFRFPVLVDQGLLSEELLSPYVSVYRLTDLGRNNVYIQTSGRSANYFFYYMGVELENVLEKEVTYNQYNVPVAMVRYTVVPKLADWAAGHSFFQSGGSGSNNSRGSRAQYSAELWKTDSGWEIFDISR